MTVQKLNYVLGNNIKLYRQLKDLSQGELAKKLGVIQSTLSHWERGSRMLSGSSLILVSSALGVEVWELFYTGRVVLMGDEKLENNYGVKNAWQ